LPDWQQQKGNGQQFIQENLQLGEETGCLDAVVVDLCEYSLQFYIIKQSYLNPHIAVSFGGPVRPLLLLTLLDKGQKKR